MSDSTILTEKNFTAPTETPQVRVVKFTNFSDEDFTHTWNKIPYTFKAGAVKFMEWGIARHFAKHLVNRELTKRGRDSDTSPKKPDENPYFMDLFNQCIGEVETDGSPADQTKLEQDIIDRNMKAQLGIKDETPEVAPESVPEKAVATDPAPAAKAAPKSNKGGKTNKNKSKDESEESEQFEILEGPADDSDEE